MAEVDKVQELLAANLILPIIKDLVAPKIIKVVQKLTSRKVDALKLENSFEEYLRQRYLKFMIIDTLVFPNMQTSFDLLYEPLTLQTHEASRKFKVKINDYPESFLPGYCRVIIEDTAGMGKSTVAKKLFKSAIEQKSGVPILIELRHLNHDNSIMQEIKKQLSPIGKSVPLSLIVKIINEGGFIFLFDGYDEIANANRDAVIKDLHNFIEKSDNNSFLITSRYEASLASFGDFQKFNIEPLTRKEAYSLIRRYDRYSYKKIASNLIQELKKNTDEAIAEFLENPLLVSLLFKSYEYKKDIPLKKTQFYQQVFSALFESHDLSKEGYFKREKYTKLHIDDFERVLRHVGYFTAIQNKVEYELNDIQNTIELVKKYVSDLNFKSSDFVKDLLETVPLFKREANQVKWAHKSLQDYFAAKFIWMDAKENRDKVLEKIYKDDGNSRFYNIIELFYELDVQAFESTLLYWFLDDFRRYARESYSGVNVSERLIKKRIENTFHKSCYIQIIDEEGSFGSVKSTIQGRSDEPDEPLLPTFNFQELKIILQGNNGKSVSLERAEGYYRYVYIDKQELIMSVAVFYKSNINTMLRFVLRKEPNLVRINSPFKIADELTFLKKNSFYATDESKDNILNEEAVFEKVTNLMSMGVAINSGEALARLERIETSNLSKTQEELLNW